MSEHQEPSAPPPEEVDGVAEENQQDQLEHPHFDLTILVPKPSFSKPSSNNANASKDGINLDDYLYLNLPTSTADYIRDIKQTVSESPEGFWIGSHSFRRIVLKEQASAQEGEEPDVVVDGPPSEVLSEALDLGRVFSDEMYKGHTLRRVLLVAETPFTDTEARLHVLRLHDASLGYLTALQSKRLYQPQPFDPSALALNAGLTVYPFIRAPFEDEDGDAAANGAPVVNGQEPSLQSSKKGKGKGKAAKPAPKSPKPDPPIAPAAKKADSTSSSSAWLTTQQDPLQVHLARKNYLPSTSLPSAAFKSLQLSVWNPPPQHLRLRGHHLYLTITTLEGENFQVTACEQGFYINRSDNHHFDPAPRGSSSVKAQAAHRTHHSLFKLLSTVSPQFAQKTDAVVADASSQILDFFASAPISTCTPAAPWLVDNPDNLADAARSQLAYLYTGSMTAEALPTARDWNEELTSMRELPRETNDDRLVRDRYAAKLLADFQAAAARAIPSIARGDIPPLSAIDPAETKSYLANNILFTQAQDAVDAFAHLGGNEAARVTAGKDLWAAKLLNDADILKLNTIATAVVDYCGERWVAQAIPPGIFDRGLTASENAADDKAAASQPGDASTNGQPEAANESKSTTPAPAGLRAVYGPANTDKPNEGYVANPVFEPLAKEVAQHFHLAKHTVKDTKGRETELWTPSDVHGIIAADGRAYMIDLFRLFPVDVNFLESDVAGKIYGEGEATEASENETYPHRIVLLRSELVELYHGTQTREWIEKQVEEKSAKEKPVKSSEHKEITDGTEDKSIDTADSATSEEFVKIDKEQAGDSEKAQTTEKQANGEAENSNQTIIDVGDFKLAFNPDAFVDRPDQALHSADTARPDNEEASTKAVRDASNFLRQTVIPSLLREVITDEIIPLDSAHLSSILHKKGINIRYLGYIANATKDAPQMPGVQKLSDSARQEVLSFLAKFKTCLVRDMVVRGAKHVLRSLTNGLRTVELTEAIAHFLNCLLFSNSQQMVNTTGSASPWTKLNAGSVREKIAEEVRRRFRYDLPAAIFESDLPKAQVLRELALSSGLQLQLRAYFAGSQPEVNGTTASDTDAKSPKNAASSNKQSKSPQHSRPQPMIAAIQPEDILNIYPIVKQAPYRSAFVENMFEQGQLYYMRGQLDHGEAFVTEALSYYENIFGSVHPELGDAYRTMANLYHRVAQPLLRRIQVYQASSALARDDEEAWQKIRTETGFTDEESVKTAKAHYEAFSEQAIKLTRQAVIILERTLGLDSQAVLQCYSDLAIFESQAGNSEQAMRCLQQAAALSTSMYGDNHPEKAKAAFFAASIVKRSSSDTSAFYKAAQEVANQAYGPNSIISANSSYQLAQSYIVGNQLNQSIPHFEEAIRIFETRLAKDSESAREATQLLAAVRQAIQVKQQGELEKVQKLAKRLGSDPARAKELISRMQGGSTSAAKKAILGTSATEAAAPPKNDSTGSRGHLDVDELVQFIEGSTGKSAGKGKKAAKR